MTVPLTHPLDRGTTDGAEPGRANERRRVLVVDDFDDAREMYAEYLEFVGFQVDVARNGVEAVEKAQGAPPHIILMDLSLPVMDGWEATRRLKQDLRTRDIPVMALSGHVLAGNAEQARQAGAGEVIAKPGLPQEMENHIPPLPKPNK